MMLPAMAPIAAPPPTDDRKTCAFATLTPATASETERRRVFIRPLGRPVARAYSKEFPPPRRLNSPTEALPVAIVSQLSAFLPQGFDPRKPVALIAGQGLYPQLVARAVRAAGIPLRLVAFEEETPPELIATFAKHEFRLLKVGQLGHMLPQVVDKLTPQGQVPQGDLASQLGSLDLGGLLGGLLKR